MEDDPFIKRAWSAIGAVLGLTPAAPRAMQSPPERFPPEIRRTPFEPTLGPSVRPDMIRYGGKSIKGPGWLGPINMTGDKMGYTMTELSVGDPNTDEGFYPLLVPGMPQSAIDNLASGGKATTDDYERARKHYEMRRAKGLDPFRSHKEPQGRSGPEDPRNVLVPSPMLNQMRKDSGMGSDDPFQSAAALEAWRRPAIRPR